MNMVAAVAAVIVVFMAKLKSILIVILLPLNLVCSLIEPVASQLDGEARTALGLLVTQALPTSILGACMCLHCVDQ